MSDTETNTLLTEIRDQQKRQIELAETALKNQGLAIERQAEAKEFFMKRMKLLPALLVGALVLVIVVLLLMVRVLI